MSHRCKSCKKNMWLWAINSKIYYNPKIKTKKWNMKATNHQFFLFRLQDKTQSINSSNNCTKWGVIYIHRHHYGTSSVINWNDLKIKLCEMSQTNPGPLWLSSVHTNIFQAKLNQCHCHSMLRTVHVTVMQLLTASSSSSSSSSLSSSSPSWSQFNKIIGKHIKLLAWTEYIKSSNVIKLCTFKGLKVFQPSE